MQLTPPSSPSQLRGARRSPPDSARSRHSQGRDRSASPVRRSSLDGLGRRSDLGTALPPPPADDWSGLNDRLRRDYDENVALLAEAKARRELIVLPDEPRRARGAKLEMWLAECAKLTGAQDRAIADLEAKVNPSEDCARARLALARPFYASEVTTALNAVLDPVREQLEMIDDAKRRVPKQLEERYSAAAMALEGGNEVPIIKKSWTHPVPKERVELPPYGVVELECPQCGGRWDRRFGTIYEKFHGHQDYVSFKCPDCTSSIAIEPSEFGFGLQDQNQMFRSDRGRWKARFR